MDNDPVAPAFVNALFHVYFGIHMVFIVFCDKRGQSNEPLTIIYCAGIENFSLVCIPISSETRQRPH
jgi:hypothetical protein